MRKPKLRSKIKFESKLDSKLDSKLQSKLDLELESESLGVYKCSWCDKKYNSLSPHHKDNRCTQLVDNRSHSSKCGDCYIKFPDHCFRCDYCKLIGINLCMSCMKTFIKYDSKKDLCMKYENYCDPCKVHNNKWCGECDSCEVAKKCEIIQQCILCGNHGDLPDKCTKCSNVYCLRCNVKIQKSIRNLTEIKNKFEHLGMKVEYYVCECVHGTSYDCGTLTEPGSLTKAAIK